VRDLEGALGITAKESVPRLPSLFLSRQQKALKEIRKRFELVVRRHEERCEALYYGLGVVQEGDTWRAPAEEVGLKAKKRLSGESEKSQVDDPGVEVREVAGIIVDREEERPVEQAVEAEDAAPGGDVVQEVKGQSVSKA